MYCGECGSKLKKGDLFCGECGAKVQKKETKEVKKEEKKKVKSNKVPVKLSKKKKIMLTIVAIFIVLVIGVYIFFANRFSPEGVATRYLETILSGNVEEIYEVLEVDKDNPFVTLEKFKKIYKENTIDLDAINYKLTNVEYGEGDLTSTVTFKLVAMGEEETLEIPLVKASDNKFLFFDNWKINDSDNSYIIQDYQISVPKNADVKLDGTKVDKKYLDKDESSDSVDVYTIPEIFVGNYALDLTLENGIEINDEIYTSSYGSNYTTEINIEDVSEEVLKDIEESIEKDINNLYKNIIDKKDWDSIKNNYKNTDTEEIKSDYEELYEEIVEDDDMDLTKFSVTSVEINDLSIEEDRFKVDFTFDYDYSITYTNFLDETENKDDDGSNRSTILYDYIDDNYKLYDIDGKVTYFSRW